MPKQTTKPAATKTTKTRTPKANPVTSEQDTALPVAVEPEAPKSAEDETPKAQPTRDAFGSLLGSKQAAINAALTAEPQTMKEIVARAGIVDRTFYNHLKRLAAAGKIVKDGGKFRLP